MPRQIVPKDSTVTLVSYPLVRPDEGLMLAQPTAATARLSTPAVKETAFTACTRDTIAASLLTASEGDTLLTVGSTISVVGGRRYLIADTDPRRSAWVEAAGSTTASTSVYITDDLPVAVTAGAVLTGMAVSRTLTALETATEGRALIEWTATIGGQVYSWAEEFAIVRRVPRWELTTDLLTRRWPDVLEARDRSDVDLRDAIEGALEEELLPRLRAKGIEEQDIISTWALVPAHVAAVKLFTSTTPEQRSAAREELDAKLDLAMLDKDAWYDAPQTSDPNLAQERQDFSGLRYTR